MRRFLCGDESLGVARELGVSRAGLERRLAVVDAAGAVVATGPAVVPRETGDASGRGFVEIDTLALLGSRRVIVQLGVAMASGLRAEAEDPAALDVVAISRAFLGC